MIELKDHPKRSITLMSGERMDAAIRKYAPHLRGLEPVQVFVQEYDPRLSTRFRYTPAPQLLELLRRELRQAPAA
ncbi:MAG: hypothetical protein C4333_12450 [Meiothermus sp.]